VDELGKGVFDRIVASAMHVQVRHVHALQADACAGAAL
jgi:hypothetical protein